MAQPDRQPASFLSLSRELRQEILYLAITDKHFKDDIVFNASLQAYDNNILAVILSYTSGLPTYSSKNPASDKDEGSFESFSTAYHQLREYGVIPVHITTLAETLASVHSLVKEDMPWVLQRWFKELAARMSMPLTVTKKKRRRQSIYVPEPFGGVRRLDKFTLHGIKSDKAIKIGRKKALQKFKKEWVTDMITVVGGEG
jgi:hypothetical protein